MGCYRKQTKKQEQEQAAECAKKEEENKLRITDGETVVSANECRDGCNSFFRSWIREWAQSVMEFGEDFDRKISEQKTWIEICANEKKEKKNKGERAVAALVQTSAGTF